MNPLQMSLFNLNR